MIGRHEEARWQRYGRGLEGLVAGETAISELDGERGRLRFRGIPVEELAGHASFEEVSHLVLFGALPDAAALRDWREELAGWRGARALEGARAALRHIPRSAHPLAQYRTMLAVAACRTGDRGVVPRGEPARLLAWSADLAAAAIRHLTGGEALAPAPDLGFAAQFLYQTLGRVPSPEEARAFEVSLIVQAEHGLHAAALAALVVFSTGADLGSAVLAGMGALSGVRHGGANQLAFEMLEPLRTSQQAREWAREQLARGHRFPGFGHRVYRCPDPRVRCLEPYARALLRAAGLEARWRVYTALRETVEEALGPRGIHANVDSITGLLYHPLGLPVFAFPIPFCLAIQAGWMAHCLEYLPAGAMIEPGAVFLSETGASRPARDGRDGG